MPVGPVIVSIVFFATIGIIIGATIFTRHRERVALIEKGAGADGVRSLYQKHTYGGEPLGSLKWGMILSGVAVLVGTFHLLAVHFQKVLRWRPRSVYSLVLALALIGTFLLGLALGPGHAAMGVVLNDPVAGRGRVHGLAGRHPPVRSRPTAAPPRLVPPRIPKRLSLYSSKRMAPGKCHSKLHLSMSL